MYPMSGDGHVRTCHVAQASCCAFVDLLALGWALSGCPVRMRTSQLAGRDFSRRQGEMPQSGNSQQFQDERVGGVHLEAAPGRLAFVVGGSECVEAGSADVRDVVQVDQNAGARKTRQVQGIAQCLDRVEVDLAADDEQRLLVTVQQADLAHVLRPISLLKVRRGFG
jgi:hypothetical protein